MFQDLRQGLGKAQSFIFGAGTDTPTYEALKRKREITDLLMQQSMNDGPPQNLAEGVGGIAEALIGRWSEKRLSKQEDAERGGISDKMREIAGILGGGSGGYSGAPMTMSGREGPQAEPYALPPQGDMAARIKSGLVNRGMPEHVADGFVLNFQDESGLNPGINEENPTVPGSRGGFGLAQWTGPRRKMLEAQARQAGRSPADLELQLDFLMSELSGSEKGAAGRIMSARNSGEAAAAIATDFLRPAQQHLDARVAKYTGGAGYQGGSSQPNYEVITQLTELMANPYMNEGQRAVAQALISQQMQNADPMRALQMQQAQQGLTLGQMEIDNYGKPEAMSPYEAARIELERADQAKGPEPTTAMREYQDALAQGFQGTLIDFKKATQRPGTSVNVMPNGQPDPNAALYGELDKAEGKRFSTILDTAPMVGRVATQIAELEPLLAQVETGGGAAIKAWLGEKGFKTEGLDDIQALSGAIASMVPGQRPPGSGTMSDADLALFKSSIPQLIVQPGGNQQIIATMKAINDYDKQIVQIASDVANRTMTPAQGRDAMNALANPLEGFKAMPKAADAPMTQDGIVDFGAMSNDQLKAWIAENGG